MESNETVKERAPRRDMAGAHAWLLALQEWALGRGYAFSGDGFVEAPDADVRVKDAMAQIVGQVRAGYRTYTGSWDFRSWPQDDLPYPLLAKFVPRESRWVSADGKTERIKKLGEISHRKVAVAAAECAEPWSRHEFVSGPLGAACSVKVPAFVPKEFAQEIFKWYCDKR
jgi:hypothetical protein